MADQEDTGTRQRISRMPSEENTTGPFFPSGMSAPEAAMAGAVADMSDEDREQAATLAEEYGLDPAPDQPDRVEPVGAADPDDVEPIVTEPVTEPSG